MPPRLRVASSGLWQSLPQQVRRAFAAKPRSEPDAPQLLLMHTGAFQNQVTQGVVGDGVHEQFLLDHGRCFGAHAQKPPHR